MQYLQTMAIFLTPTFFLNFPTAWLNCVDWLSFTALFDITLAFGQCNREDGAHVRIADLSAFHYNL